MKRVLVLALTVILVFTLFSACSGGDKTSTTTPTTTAAETKAETTAPPAPDKIVASFGGVMPKDLKMVNAELNKLTAAKANVEVELLVIETANYAQQINLMIASKEKLDVVLTFPTPAVHFATMTSQNQLMDITDLVPKYAPDAIEAFKAVNIGYLDGTKVNGRLYGFTCLFDKVSGTWASFRKDVMEKNKLDLSTVKNMKDLEDILAVLKKNESIAPWFGDFVGMPLLINPDDFSKNTHFDSLGEGNYRYGVVIGDSTKVENLFETEWYKNIINIARDWYKKGYIYKDAATTTEMSYNLVGSNAVLGILNMGESEHTITIDGRTKYEMVNANFGNGMVSTSMIQKFAWAVTSICTKPEAALKFINLLYSDSDVLNMINYGIKGTHYVDGSEPNLIKRPEGVTIQNATYGTMGSFLFGNQYITKIWEPGPNNLRQIALDANKNANVSKLMGLSVDNSKFKNEFTAVTAVCDQYRKGLEYGVSDPAKVLPEFLKALDAAGMKTIIAEVQKQVDAFLAAKK